MIEKATLKIFIASSGELKTERNQAILVLERLENAYRGYHLKPILWDYAMLRGSFFDAENIQSVITPKLRESEIAIFIFYSRLGVYTLEEFECAKKEKKKTFIFFKKGFLPNDEQEEQAFNKVKDFKDSLNTTVLSVDFDSVKDFEYELFVNINLYLSEKIESGIYASFNRYLTKNLIESLALHNQEAKDFLRSASDASANWENEPEIRNIGQEFMTSNFMGILSIQLSKIFAIGKEELSESKQKRYIENCAATCKISLQMIWFIFISDFWKIQKSNSYTLRTDQASLLKDFFDTSFEPTIMKYIKWLKCIIEFYKEKQLPFPIDDLVNLDSKLSNEGNLIKAFTKIYAINNKLDDSNFSIIDCREAEIHLTEVLSNLIFFTNYKMISIKSIAYDEMLDMSPRYLHSYTALGIDSKNAEEINYVETPVKTEAILFFKNNGEYKNGINVYPFIIDMNALTFESGSKICFYNRRHLKDQSLNFKLFENDTNVNIVFNGITNSVATLNKLPSTEFNKLLSDKENRKKLKLDDVVLHFNNARKIILGNSGE